MTDTQIALQLKISDIVEEYNQKQNLPAGASKESSINIVTTIYTWFK